MDLFPQVWSVGMTVCELATLDVGGPRLYPEKNV